jgi:hypothetical protein
MSAQGGLHGATRARKLATIECSVFTKRPLTGLVGTSSTVSGAVLPQIIFLLDSRGAGNPPAMTIREEPHVPKGVHRRAVTSRALLRSLGTLSSTVSFKSIFWAAIPPASSD